MTLISSFLSDSKIGCILQKEPMRKGEKGGGGGQGRGAQHHQEGHPGEERPRGQGGARTCAER